MTISQRWDTVRLMLEWRAGELILPPAISPSLCPYREVGSVPEGVPCPERAPPCGRAPDPAALLRAQQHPGAVQTGHRWDQRQQGRSHQLLRYTHTPIHPPMMDLHTPTHPGWIYIYQLLRLPITIYTHKKTHSSWIPPLGTLPLM